MPLVAVSFSGYTRFDLDQQLTHFFNDESIGKEKIVHISFWYYENYQANVVYFANSSISDEDLNKIHRTYTSNPITSDGIAVSTSRDEV